MNKLTSSCLVLACFSALNADRAHAAAPAIDNAADNAAYGNFWQTGDNGGTGFGTWTLSTTVVNASTGGFFMDTSQENGNADGNINTGGTSWGMYANSGNVANAVRPFLSGGLNGNALLGVGEIFKISMDNGSIDSGGTVGFGLQNSSGTNELEFYFVGGTSEYQIKVGTTPAFNTGIPFTSKGLALTFTQGASNGWTLAVTTNGNTTSYSHLTSGSTTLPASDISQVRAFNANAGSTGTRDAFINSMQVIPEPGTSLLAMGGAALLAARRRRRA